MTVIAWDGKTLAADKQATNCGNPYKVTKIYKLLEGPDAGALVAFSGSGVHAFELLEWFRNGRVKEMFPKSRAHDPDDGAGAIFIDCKKKIHLYTHYSPFAEVIEESLYARGSGRDYALAVLHLGETAKRAVEVACALDVSCGLGIDTLTLGVRSNSRNG